MASWRARCRGAARAVVRAVPGVGIAGLCAAIVAALVVPAVLSPQAEQPAPAGRLRAPHAALASANRPKPANQPAPSPVPCPLSGDTVTCSLSTYGAVTTTKNGTVTIPASVETVRIQVDGAPGGGHYPGGGGEVSGSIDMAAVAATAPSGWDRKLHLVAGANGSDHTGNTGGSGGSPGGGAGGTGGDSGGSGGGGWTGITLTGNAVAVAGGGGGTGGYGAGADFTQAGSGGETGSGGSGGGAGGSGICHGGGGGGGGGGQNGGGDGGGGNGCTAGTSGGNGSALGGGGGGGGNGATPGGGGGGGAGWYGGGGGAGGGTDGSGGGGGGGSDHVHGTTWVRAVSFTGTNTGNASVTLSWTLQPTTISLSVSTSTPQAGKTVVITAAVDTTAGVPVTTGKVSFTGAYGSPTPGCITVPVSGGVADCTMTAPGSSSVPSEPHYYGASYNPSSSNLAYAPSAVTPFPSSSLADFTTVPDRTTIDPVVVTPASTKVRLGLSAKVVPPSFATTGFASDQATFYWAPSAATPAGTRTVACTNTVSASHGASVTVTCSFTTDVPGTTYYFSVTVAAQGENAAAGPSTPAPYTPDKGTPTVTLSVPGSGTGPIAAVYGKPITLQVKVSGLPKKDTRPGSVTFETGTHGTPLTCMGGGENPLPGSNVNRSFEGTCIFLPGAGGTLASGTVSAVYSGDGETTAEPSNALPFTVSKATATTTVTAAPNPSPVGAPVTLTATVGDPHYPATPITGEVEFEENGAALSGCEAVLVTNGTATCTQVTAPTRITTLHFSAIFCPSGATAVDLACTDWSTNTSATATDPTAPDPTRVVLTPTATQTHPYTSPGGKPVTVTATVSTTAGHQAVTGTVAFKENGGAVGGCAAVPLRTGVASCTFVPVKGNEDTVLATFTPTGAPLVVGSRSAKWYVKASAQKTTMSVSVAGPSGPVAAGGSVPFGVPLTATAVVTSTGFHVPSGTVAFAVGGTPVATCGAQPVDTTGRATCTLVPAALPAGAATVTASFAYAGGTYAQSRASQVFDVTAAPTSGAVTVGPTSATVDLLMVTVTDAAVGAEAPPTGAVTVTTTSGAAACTAVALVPAAGPSSVATCAVARPTTATTFQASYSPADGDFAVLPAAATLAVTPGAACSTTFAAVWTRAGTPLSLSIDGASGLGSLDLTLGGITGPCVATATVPFTGASLDLFGKTLASAAVSGYVEDGQSPGSSPLVCLTGGTLGLPGGWSIGSVTLSATEKLCFSIVSVSGSTGTLGAPVGSLSASGAALPFGFPTTSTSYVLTVELTTAPAPTMTVDVAPTSPPSSSPYATVTMTVAGSGGGFSATGTIEIENLPFLGAPLDAKFSASTGSSGSIAGSLTLSVPAGTTYSPVPGLTMKGLGLTLSSATGFGFTANALLGQAGNQVSVTLEGGYHAHQWALTLTATKVTRWEPVTGLTISPTLSGSLTITTAGSSAVVTYDFEAGTPPSNHTPGSPLVRWTAGGGITVTLSCVAFAFGAAPACGAGPTASRPTDPTLFAQGAVAFGATAGSGITAGFAGSFDLKDQAVALSYDATAGPVTAQPVTGLTLSLTTLKVSGEGRTLTVTGTASAAVAALGAASFTLSFSDTAGTLVIAGLVSFAGSHVPLTGLLAYASTTVKTFTSGISTVGKVDLSKGFSGFAVYHPTGAVLAVLGKVDTSLGSGAAVVFRAAWAPGGSPSFSLTLAAGGGFPFLSLPDTGKITTATLGYAGTTLSLQVTGTIPVPGSTPAPTTLALTVGTGAQAGTFTGHAAVTTLVVLGQKVGLTGSVSRAATGTITATVSSCEPKSGTCAKGPIPGPLTPFPGVPAQLSTVSFSLGTGGISVAATMSVDGLGSLSMSGSLQKLETWSLTVQAAAAQTWNPVPGVTLSPSFTGTVTDKFGTVSFSLVASGANGSPLFTLSPGPVTLTVASVGLGNAAPPAGCSVEKVGDLWLTVRGSLGMSLGTASGSATATGCFDLTSKSFSLSATVTSLKFTALTGHVAFGAPTITISGSSGSYQVAADATLTVTMPTGGRLVARATIAFGSGGDFVIGAEVDLSQWLGTDGDAAYLYYSSKAVGSFETGDATLGKIALVKGITFGVAISLPTSVVTGLDHVGIHLPAHTGFAAVGSITFTSDIFRLKVSVGLGSGLQIFTAGGVKLLLDSGFLQVVLSPSVAEFGVGLSATLHLPSVGAGGRASTVLLTGQLTVSDTDVAVTLSLGSCGATTTAWFTAFGIPGLTVRCAALTGDITYEFPFVSVGFSGTITSLPPVISKVTGYQTGAPISFAFNLDPLLLSLSIGTKNSTTPALEPLAAFGEGTLMKVDYASLYIAPEGATIGSTVYPAGISMGFQATLFSVRTSILASIGLSPPSITFTATVSKITLYGLSIGPVSVVLAASAGTHPKFEFQFTGTASLGPGSVKIGPDLKVGGALSASVQVTVSTKGLSAFIWGSASLTVSAYVATRTCYRTTVWPYACHYEWETTGFSVTLTRTGFSITSSGVTLEADGYKVTLDYDGHVSASLASVERRTARPHVAGSVRRDRTMPSMALTATRQRLTTTPTTAPVPPPSGPRLTGGKAVLVPTTSVVQPATSPNSSTAGSVGGSGSNPVTVRPVSGPAVGSWKVASPMASARAFPATATLRNGDVLVAGGTGESKQPLASAEVYDPVTGRWSPAGSLSAARVGATATVLRNGDVLVAGGFGATRQPLASAELFDPTTGTFSPTGSLHDARAFASSELLADGDVLVLGGVGTGHAPLRTAELYDPKTGTFSSTGSMQTAHAFGALAALPDGDVLVAGGQDATGPLAAAERYDPSSGTWSPAGKMTEPRAMASAATLANGDVLVVGDSGDGDVYDSSTGTWKQTQGLPAPVTMPMMAPLPDGQVLVAGGESMGTSVATAFLYRPASGAWQNAGSMPAAKTGAAAAVLSNGQVLVAGGGNVTADAGGPPTITTEATTSLFSPPAGTGAQPGARPTGAPLAVVSSSPLPIALGSAGGAVALAGLALWAYERRRLRVRATSAPPEA